MTEHSIPADDSPRITVTQGQLQAIVQKAVDATAQAYAQAGADAAVRYLVSTGDLAPRQAADGPMEREP